LFLSKENVFLTFILNFKSNDEVSRLSDYQQIFFLLYTPNMQCVNLIINYIFNFISFNFICVPFKTLALRLHNSQILHNGLYDGLF